MIRCDKLTRRYGRHLALDSLDLHVEKGQLHGFVGMNGAGKTTAMRILATLLRPTSGRAYVGGVDVAAEPQKARALVGYMPDFFGVYDDLKAWEYLDLYAGCLGLNAKERRWRIDELLDLTALLDKREACVEHLSRGMKQRLCLARAMLHDPQLLILDEPASGMDPRARAQMRDILREIGDTGKTVLISSHILPELSQLCDSMTILERGKLVFTGTAEEMERRISGESRLVFRLSREIDETLCAAVQEAIETEYGKVLDNRGGLLWEIESVRSEEEDASLLAHLASMGVPVCEFRREKATLEKVFMEVTQTHDESGI